MTTRTSFAAAFLALVCASRDAAAEGSPGITYTDETHGGQAGHVVRIDRCKANVEIRVTSEAQRYKTVEDFATTNAALVAINASYFDPYYEPNPATALASGKANGTTISDGVAWTRIYASLSAYAAWTSDATDFQMLRTGAPLPSNLTQAAAAFWAVKGGVACDGATPAICSSFTSSTTKRTIFGVDKSRSTIFFAVVDAASPPQAARFARDMGAHDALNYDSGGSTALYLKGAGYKVATSRHVINAIVATASTKPPPSCGATSDAGSDAGEREDGGPHAGSPDSGTSGGVSSGGPSRPSSEPKEDDNDASPSGCSNAGGIGRGWSAALVLLVAAFAMHVARVVRGLRRA